MFQTYSVIFTTLDIWKDIWPHLSILRQIRNIQNTSIVRDIFIYYVFRHIQSRGNI